MVKVTLTEARTYTDADGNEVTVGPGEVEMTWEEAAALGFNTAEITPIPEPDEPVPFVPTTANPTPPLPFEGYDDLTVAEVVELKPSMSAAEWGAVVAYEAANKARKGILEA